MNAGGRATQQLIRKLKKQGFVVTLGKGGHYKATHPERDGLVCFSATPRSDRFPQTIKMLKQMGFKP